MAKNKWWEELAWASTVGLTLVFSTVIGLMVGLYLDKLFQTKPILGIFFLLLGIIAGFVNIFRRRKN
ncbi:MAG: AtpZ/AtpI family protein [Elusimicrobiota bacterium]